MEPWDCGGHLSSLPRPLTHPPCHWPTPQWKVSPCSLQGEGQQMNSPGMTRQQNQAPLYWKYTEKRLIVKTCELRLFLENVLGLLLVWERAQPGFIGRDQHASGIIIITAIINVWIPLLSTYLDDFIMGSLQVWLVSGFQNKTASSNLDFLSETPLAVTWSSFQQELKTAAIPF